MRLEGSRTTWTNFNYYMIMVFASNHWIVFSKPMKITTVKSGSDEIHYSLCHLHSMGYVRNYYYYFNVSMCMQETHGKQNRRFSPSGNSSLNIFICIMYILYTFENLSCAQRSRIDKDSLPIEFDSICFSLEAVPVSIFFVYQML